MAVAEFKDLFSWASENNYRPTLEDIEVYERHRENIDRLIIHRVMQEKFTETGKHEYIPNNHYTTRLVAYSKYLTIKIKEYREAMNLNNIA